MKDRILKLLKEENDFISGQKISNELGVSRTAIWKHINALRKDGYNIESVSNKGYKIVSSPDILTYIEIEQYLKTSYIGRSIIHFDTIDSTNNKAKELSVLGSADNGCVVISEEQVGGKGRLGKQWVSPKNKGVWMSIILKPNIEPSDASIVTQIGAAAVYRVIKNMSLNSYIKWPNDVLINNRKVCGILTEMNAELSRINYIVMGIGINVNLDEEDFSKDLKGIATSLKMEAKKTICRKQLVAQILNEFEQLYDDYVNNNNIRQVIEICKQASIVLGKQISIISKGKIVSAKALDMNERGELIVKYDDGTIGSIISGEVSIRGQGWYV